jgi:glycosyltransferase involved in cell wall biosynthesis
MKILMLCHDYPTPNRGDATRAYNLIKHFSKKYDYEIVLASFKDKTAPRGVYRNLDPYCQVSPPIEIDIHGTFFRNLLFSLRNTWSVRNLFSNHPNFLNYYYSPKMDTVITELLKNESFDAIYADGSMAHYVSNVDLPKIVEPLDALSFGYHERFLEETNAVKKMILWLWYLKSRHYERSCYKYFDHCVVVTNEDKRALEHASHLTNVVVIPMGTDISHFKPIDVHEDPYSLTFVSSLRSSNIITSLLSFYFNVFPAIVQEYPDTQFRIIGPDPPEVIRNLASEANVAVTGYVDDVRPYLAKTSLVVVPMLRGTGMKSKVLEAMAMGKPVISTSIGVQGIEVTHGKDILIANSARDFITCILALLGNEGLRKIIGSNARELIEQHYSWEQTAATLNELFQSTVGE